MSTTGERRIIQTSAAPAAIGPYSQAVAAAGVIFTSGQIGLDPRTGQLVEGGIEAQTRQVLKNLQAVLEAAGSNMSRIMKTTVYLADMQDFAVMNQAYGEILGGQPPARSTVAVKALPKGALIEIDAIAFPVEA